MCIRALLPKLIQMAESERAPIKSEDIWNSTRLSDKIKKNAPSSGIILDREVFLSGGYQLFQEAYNFRRVLLGLQRH